MFRNITKRKILTDIATACCFMIPIKASNACYLQDKATTMITLVVDVIVPFITISILNAILIRAINHRNKDLEEFNESSGSKHSSTTGTLNIIGGS